MLFSSSFSQLDSSTWNIDMQELEYNPSKKDLTDAKIHHLLAEELVKPYRRVSKKYFFFSKKNILYKYNNHYLLCNKYIQSFFQIISFFIKIYFHILG